MRTAHFPWVVTPVLLDKSTALGAIMVMQNGKKYLLVNLFIDKVASGTDGHATVISGTLTKSQRGLPKRSKDTNKAGLVFPFGRIQRFLGKGMYARSVGDGAPVYLAAVMEYLAKETLEDAGNAARIDKETKIKPKHISQLDIWNTEEAKKSYKAKKESFYTLCWNQGY